MSDIKQAANIIESGKAVMGMELGSTRIKAVLIGPDNSPLASGGHDWENSQKDGIWTYSLDEVWAGISSGIYADLKENVREKYNVELNTIRRRRIQRDDARLSGF